jgi:arginine N-succinyltransferase
MEMPNALAHEYILRDVRPEDIEDIVVLGSLLNTVNLPANKAELTEVVQKSDDSFGLSIADHTKRSFLFGLADSSDRVIGTAQAFAKHGTLDSPNIFFRVEVEERYSATLRKYFRHKVLRLIQNFDGLSELGSLVLAPEYRSTTQKLGRNLSYIRLLFMAMEPEFFAGGVIAELLPPLGENFESALWNAIGRRFTGLPYYEADILSRQNKEFIRTLFPTCEIYASLLPECAQEVIGEVGPKSQGARHLLTRIGFTYNNCIDPFDGGPHFTADNSQITLFKKVTHGVAKPDAHLPMDTMGLVAYYDHTKISGRRFRATMAPYVKDPATPRISLHPRTFNALGLEPGARIALLDDKVLRGQDG